HYSNVNIKEVSLLEALKQPLFMAFRENQPFNDNHLLPCPMLENPEFIEKMVKETKAKSTDLKSPEKVEDLVAKTRPYAEQWRDRAEKLWNEINAEKSTV